MEGATATMIMAGDGDNADGNRNREDGSGILYMPYGVTGDLRRPRKHVRPPPGRN